MRTYFSVRRAVALDAPGLLILMRELAHCEHYLDRFLVTEAALLSYGLGDDREPKFVAYVAESDDGNLLGYAVVYLVPFTFDLRPNLILKELYVKGASRGLGIGRRLLDSVIAHANECGCAHLKWNVLPENISARKFYRNLGGTLDTSWENWMVPIKCG